jgi:hypothetical protein
MFCGSFVVPHQSISRAFPDDVMLHNNSNKIIISTVPVENVFLALQVHTCIHTAKPSLC